MTKGLVRALTITVALAPLLAHPVAWTQEKGAAKPAPQGGRSQAPREEGRAAPGGDTAMNPLVEEMKKYTAPGPRHADLSAFAGQWTTRTKVWASPDTRPVEFPGSAESRMILGGRFLMLDSRSRMNDVESHGLGIYGYDAFKEKYSFYYIHDNDTQALIGFGDRDSTSGAITFAVAMDMPISGESAKPIRTVLRRVSSARYTFEMFERYLDDREWKVLEITYERAR